MKRSLLKDERLLVVAVVMLAFAVRVTFLALPRVVRWDEAAHQLIAHSLLAGRGFSELVGARDVQQGPLVAYLSLPGVWLGWPVPWATGGIAYALFGGLLPLPLYGVGRRLYGRRIGGMAALLAAVYPALVAGPLYWGTMTEPPYLFFIISGLYCTWRAAENVYHGARPARTMAWGLGLGVNLGLAYLTRPEALAYLAVMLFFVILAGVVGVVSRWRGRPQRKAFEAPSQQAAQAGQPIPLALLPEKEGGIRLPSPRRRGAGGEVATVLISLVAFLVVTLPYDIYIHRVTGSWSISGKQGLASDIALAMMKGDAAETDRVGAGLDSTGREIMWLSLEQFNKSVPGFMVSSPRQFIQLVRHNIAAMWQSLFHADLFNPWMLGVVGLGLCARPWSRPRFARELLLLLMLAPLAALLAFFVISRLLVVTLPIAILWAALGLNHLANWAEKSLASLMGRGAAPEDHHSPFAIRHLPFVRLLPLAITLVACVAIGLDLVGSELPKQPFFRIETARWLAAHAPADSRVMARDSEVALYAGMPMVAFPDAEWPQVLAYGQARDARYLVVEEGEIKELRPQLDLLLNTGQPAPGVRLEAQLPGPAASKTLIYAFEGAP